MKSLAATCTVLVLLVFAGVAPAEMFLIDDFESYDVDTTIHLKGIDAGGGGEGAPRWYSQANVSFLADSNRAFVVAEGNNKVMRATTQGRTSTDPNVHVLAMSLYDHGIYGQGTIYFRFKHTGGPNDIALQTNDKWPGWDYGGIETNDINAPSFQGNCSTFWSQCGAIAFFGGHALGAGSFRGYSGGYKDTPIDTVANEWAEFWVQVDHANDRTKYFVCRDGGNPTIIMNPAGGEWWTMRNQTHDNNAVLNLRFQIGQANSEVSVLWLDDIAVDDSAMTLERPDVQHEEPLPGDLDDDGDVDLDDFVILKNAFGVSDAGDCDGDSDTDLDDFVILKNNFGTTAP